MRLVNSKQFAENYFGGYQVELLTGDFAVDGDATVKGVNFADAVVGSEYWYKVNANHVQKYVKVSDNNRDDDWVIYEGIIHQRVTKPEFTDVTTTGTLSLNATIPVGAYLEKANVRNVVAFSGDTTATIQISGGVDVTTDVDGYTTGTPSIFATADAVVVGVPSGVRTVTTAGAPLVTITSTADFTNVSAAGAMTITLFYKV
jgi:uncharacterized protein YdeI (BOF family)